VIATSSQWFRLLLGLALVFGLFHWSAIWLGSDRGQGGLAVCAIVVAALIGLERGFFSASITTAIAALGFGRPNGRGVAAAIAFSLALLLVVPCYAVMAGTTFTYWPGWIAVVPGLFAQAGIAEEALFRAYLFGHLRNGRSFWRAALLSMVPFAAVHAFIFTTNPWPIAVAAVALSIVLSMPFAHLYELGGRTIWGPAIAHAVIQGTVKVVVFPADAAGMFATLWMAASAVLGVIVLIAVKR
jgi:membrane protease YdiL (CAAX protease family)